MRNKNKKISASLRQYHKNKKSSLKIRIAMAQILVLIGLGTAGYAMACQIKFNKIIDNTVKTEAIMCENGKFATDCSLIDTEWSGRTAKVEKQTLPVCLPESNEVVLIPASLASGIMESCISVPITLEQRKENWEKVKRIAEDNDFKWISYLKLLVDCEGQFNELSINCINPGGGIDRGIFQINSKYHPEVSDECCFNLRCATEWTMMRIENGYQKEWTCDQHIKNGFQLRFF